MINNNINNNKYINIYDNFIKDQKQHIFCKYSLYNKYNIIKKSKESNHWYLNHNCIQNKSADYLFFEYLIDNNELKNSIKIIIDNIKYKKIKLYIKLKLSNWCRKKSSKNVCTKNNSTIADKILSNKSVFKDWEVALAKESVRRNKLCFRNNRFICKLTLGMKIKKSDICCGGINCKYGLHINNIKSYNGTINEAYQFNNEKKKSIIEILRMKESVYNIIKSEKINQERKLKKLLSSFMFNINKGIISKNYLLDDKNNIKNIIRKNSFDKNLFLNILDDMKDNLNKKRLATQDKYIYEIITRPGSVSPHLIEKLDWINTLRKSPVDQINSSFNYNLSKIIEKNNCLEV
jgi:hypothetical protein